MWYNSCQHRLCPQCAWLQSARGLATQKARLLAGDHSHVILTRLAELHGLWVANVRQLTQRLCATVRETLGELLGDVQYLGAQPGILAALPTWSQTVVLHPHLHGLVTGGGLTAEGQWRAVRNGLLLPVRVVRALVRGKRLAAMDTAVRRGQLVLPAGMTRRHGESLRHQLGRQPWNVHLRERYPSGAGVLTDLARSLRGGPRSNDRLVACAPGEVTVWYRSHGEGSGPARRGLMPLPSAEVIRRSLRHVPHPGTRVVRSYGRSAPTARAALACWRVQRGQGPVEAPKRLDGQTAGRADGWPRPRRRPSRMRSRVCSPSRVHRRHRPLQDPTPCGGAFGGGGMNRRPRVGARRRRDRYARTAGPSLPRSPPGRHTAREPRRSHFPHAPLASDQPPSKGPCGAAGLV